MQQLDSDLRTARAARRADSQEKLRLRRRDWDEEAEVEVEAEDDAVPPLFEPGDETDEAPEDDLAEEEEGPDGVSRR